MGASLLLDSLLHNTWQARDSAGELAGSEHAHVRAGTKGPFGIWDASLLVVPNSITRAPAMTPTISENENSATPVLDAKIIAS
jgi:hypothetical protein